MQRDMRKQLVATIAAVVATLLLAIGIAAAVEGGGAPSTPPGQSVASEAKAANQSDRSEDQDGSTASEDEATETESSETDQSSSDVETESESDGSDESGSPAGQPENHGKYVSEAAKSCPAGEGHGACVSAVAKSDQGKKGK